MDSREGDPGVAEELVSVLGSHDSPSWSGNVWVLRYRTETPLRDVLREADINNFHRSVITIKKVGRQTKDSIRTARATMTFRQRSRGLKCEPIYSTPFILIGDPCPSTGIYASTTSQEWWDIPEY